MKQKYDVLSIAAIDYNDWKELYEIIPENANVEVNLGCPNIQRNMWAGFNDFTRDSRKWCIAKIPPTFTESQIDFVIDSGSRIKLWPSNSDTHKN